MNTMQPITIHSFSSAEELTDTLADVIIERLAKAIEKKNHASLVVSGGTTPKPLFKTLSRRSLRWHKVTITLADERWVNPTDPESNEGLIKRYLLQDKAQEARFIGLKNSAASAGSGEKSCQELLKTIPRPFDIVVLGMGNDGHTASLFPGARQLDQAMDKRSSAACLAITPDSASHERMTLTLPVLLDTAQIILHITGPKKRKVLEQAMAGGPETEMPIRAILQQQITPVEIYWAP